MNSMVRRPTTERAAAAPHRVRFYGSEEGLVDSVARYLGEGLTQRQHVLVIATPAHRDAFQARLRQDGHDPSGATWLDAQETLASFMDAELPDPARFEAAVGHLLDRLQEDGRPARAFGEMVDVLWRAGNHRGAIRLEELWDDLQRSRRFELLCAYVMASFYKEPADLVRVSAVHDTVEGLESSMDMLAVASARAEIEEALRETLRELRRSEGALRASEGRLRSITDALPVLVSLVDREHRYRFVNATYERWFGRSRDQIMGKHLREVVGEEVYARVAPHMDEALAGRSVTFESVAPYRYGGARAIEATYVPHVGADGRVEGLVALVADISERKRLEAIRERETRRSERLRRVTAAIANAVQAEEVYAALVESAAEALEASSAGLWFLEPGGTATLVRSVGYSDAAKRVLSRVSIAGGSSMPIVDAIRTGEPVWLASQEEMLARYPELRPVVTAGRAYRVSCLPLVVHGKTFGGIALTFDGGPELDDEERHFLLLVARYGSQALERLRLLEAERESRARAELAAQRMARLESASALFAQIGPDLPALLRALARQVTSSFGDGCAVFLRREGSELLDVAAVDHRDEAVTARIRELLEAARPRMGEGIAGRVAATGEPVFLPTIEREKLLGMLAPQHREFAARSTPQSLIAVPLRGRAGILGVLQAARIEDSTPYDPEDARFLHELGERVALSIENARLYAEAQRARNRAELLYLLARTVIVAETADEVFDAALRSIEEGLATDRSAVLVLDADGVMRFRASRGLSEEYRRAVEGHSPWPPNARDPQPVMVEDVAADPALAAYGDLFRRENIGALGFIPLVAGGRLLGKFMVYYPRPRRMPPNELALAQAIADHVAAAITRFSTLSELQQSVRFNELFIGILGHDLRNPLAAIMTAGQLLVMRNQDEKLAKPLTRILTSGDRMARMIEQLLDFTRLRVGTGMPLQRKALDLLPVIEHVIDELDDAHPEWTLRLQHAGDTTGTWDADRLSQVFSNLVANAVQHGESAHGVDVRVDGTATDTLTVSVHNQGTIPPARLPRLFEPLIGGDRRMERSRGLGLGLYITREIVRSHGGRIEVASTPESGTTVTVTLPRVARA